MKADADPNLIVYFGGQYMPLREARVGILTHALHYGTGVFEGIRAYWDEAAQELFVMRPRDHYERWKQNCGILRIEVPLIARGVVRHHGRTDAAQRVPHQSLCPSAGLQERGAHRRGHRRSGRIRHRGAALRRLSARENGLHAGVSSWRRIEDNAIPARAKICGAYVNSALASDEARRSGFDEAILLNESGHVAEGATCNIFMCARDS